MATTKRRKKRRQQTREPRLERKTNRPRMKTKQIEGRRGSTKRTVDLTARLMKMMSNTP